MCQGEDIPRGAVLSDETERGDGRRVSGGESGEQLLGWKQTNKKNRTYLSQDYPEKQNYLASYCHWNHDIYLVNLLLLNSFWYSWYYEETETHYSLSVYCMHGSSLIFYMSYRMSYVHLRRMYILVICVLFISAPFLLSSFDEWSIYC